MVKFCTKTFFCFLQPNLYDFYFICQPEYFLLLANLHCCTDFRDTHKVDWSIRSPEKRKPLKLVSYWYGGQWQQIIYEAGCSSIHSDLRNRNRWSWWATGTEDSGNKLAPSISSKEKKRCSSIHFLLLWSQAKAADKCCRWYVDGTWFVPHLRKIGYCLSWKILIVFSCTTSHDT